MAFFEYTSFLLLILSWFTALPRILCFLYDVMDKCEVGLLFYRVYYVFSTMSCTNTKLDYCFTTYTAFSLRCDKDTLIMFVVCICIVWVQVRSAPCRLLLHAARIDQHTNFIYLFPGLLDHGLRLQLLIRKSTRPRIKVTPWRRHRKSWKSKTVSIIFQGTFRSKNNRFLCMSASAMLPWLKPLNWFE